MWYDTIVERIKKFNVKVKEVEIRANPDDINNIIVHKKENVVKLREIYEVDIIVKPNENIKPGRFETIVLKTYDDMVKEKIEV